MVATVAQTAQFNGEKPMSDDNRNAEPVDFDFDSLQAEEPQKSTGESSFDLDNPFGDDLVASLGGTTASAHTGGESSFDLAAPFGDDLAMSGEGVSADNPYLDNESALYDSSATWDSATSEPAAGSSEAESDESGDPASINLEKSDKKKKGKGGWFAKGKAKIDLTKDPKAEKETSKGEPVPRDWGTILCIAFSVFLLVSLLVFNVAGFLTRGDSLMQTLCFLATIDIIGLAAAAVPILFYKFPKERTLPNVMLGIAAVAMFSTLLFAVTEFYRYSFVMTP